MKFLYLFATLLSSTVAAYCQNNETDQIKKLNLEWLNAYPKRDTATLNRVLANDFLLTTDRGRVVTKQTLIYGIAQSAATVTFQNDTVIVRMFGNTALLTGFGTSINTDEGKIDKGQNCYSAVFVKRNGTWQAVESFIMLLRKDDTK